MTDYLKPIAALYVATMLVCLVTKIITVEAMCGIHLLLVCIIYRSTFSEFSAFLTFGAYAFILMTSAMKAPEEGYWMPIIIMLVGIAVTILTVAIKGFEGLSDLFGNTEESAD